MKLPSSVGRWPLGPGPELLLAMDAPSKDVGDEKVGQDPARSRRSQWELGWGLGFPMGAGMGAGIPAGYWDSCWILGSCWVLGWVLRFLLDPRITAGSWDSHWVLRLLLGVGILAGS